MLKLSRKSEYGIIALKYIYTKSETLCSAREISQTFCIPLETMAKILQRLVQAGFIESIKGAKGGYRLVCNPNKVNLGEVIEAIEGPIGIVECTIGKKRDCSCAQYHNRVCNIDGAFQQIQIRFKKFLEGISLSEIIQTESQLKIAEATST